MSLLSALLSAASTKVGATVAGVTIAAGGAGVAAATDNLPQPLQVQVDDLLQSENADDRADEAKADAEARKASDEVGAEGHEGEGDGSAVSDAVHDVLDANPPETRGGSNFGQLISDAARDANPSGENGQGASRRAEAQTKRETAAQNRADAQANAGDVATEDETDARPEDAGAPDGVGGGRPDGNAGGATDE